jgi:hypothetical protein
MRGISAGPAGEARAQTFPARRPPGGEDPLVSLQPAVAVFALTVARSVPARLAETTAVATPVAFVETSRAIPGPLRRTRAVG